MKVALIAFAGSALAIAGCKGAKKEAANLRGVDTEKKVLSIGILNDQSGPAAAIGKPYGVGKRILADLINAGGSGLLPEGWTVNLVERDHGYNPQRSVQAYKEIKDQVLFVGTSMGTPNTLPLRSMIEADNMMVFPASLSSKMAEHVYTPPLGPSYKVEAMRAMDWVVESAGGADKVKAGIVYQQDDYGQDGLDGWSAAAAHHGVEIVNKQTIAPGQSDFAAVITGLKEAGATHILLTVLPSATGPILGTAAKMQFMPTWIGSTASWIDRFFDPKVIPPPVFTNFYWLSGLPYWGEKVPGMDAFVAAYEKYGKELGAPDFYMLVSFIQGLTEVEVFKRAIAAGDMSPEGYAKALKSMDNWTAGGMIQSISLTKFPYVTSTQTRVLKPVMDKGTWEVVAPYAEASTITAAAAPAGGSTNNAPGEKAPQ